MTSYIGKIAAVGTINVSQIASGLNTSARDVEKYARGLKSTISSANAAAGRSFKEIFTPLQRLERALQAVQNRTIDIKVDGGVERIRAIVGAANDIAKPLAASQKQFSALSAAVQNEFVGALARAQSAAQLAENAINKGQIKNAAGYQKLKAIVDSVTESQERLSEAGAAVSGLATGRELRFQQPGFASEVSRSQRLQQSAASLPPDVIQSAAVASSVAAIRQEAEEAERLNAALENVKNTRASDTAAIAAAQAALDSQTAKIAGLNDQLDRQITLYSNVAKQREAVKSFAALVPSLQQGLDFKITGNFQSIQQARSAVESLFSQLQKLDSGQAGALSGGVGDLFAAIQTGDLGAIQAEYEKLKKAIEDEVEANVSTKDAQKQVDDLKKAARGLSDEFDFAALGVPQSIDQATAAAKGLVGELAKLSQGQISALSGDFQSLSAAIESGDLAAFQGAYARVKAAIEDGIKTNLDTTSADKRLADLQATWDRVSGGVVTRTEDVDKKFNDLSNTIAKLTSSNRLNLDPLAASFLAAVRAGAPLADQLRLLEDLAARASIAAKIETLPEGSPDRDRLQGDFDALSAASPSPAGTAALAGDADAAASRFKDFGEAIDSSNRRLGVLRSSIGSVKGQIDQLPIPLQARFVSALTKAEAEFKRLKDSGAATAAEIAKAARNVERLKAGVDRAAASAKTLGSRDIIRNLATSESLGQLEAAGRLLGVVGETAGGPVAKAFDDLRSAQAKFLRQGIADTPQAKARILELQEALAQAAAATGKISFGAALRQVKRGGDIARGAFGNAGLAIQQAAFIVDDFISVTGGIEQRLRAIGNNISQLGFVIGGTYGLIAGVGVSVGAQVATSLIKWANSGVEANDRTRALNETLKNQKTLVDQLAESFRNLGQSLSLEGFQGGARSAEEFRRQIQGLRQEQENVLRGQVAAIDPTVIRERAIQAARERELGQTDNVGRSVLLQREIEQSRVRERAAANAAFARPASPPAQIFADITREVLLQGVAEVNDALSGQGENPELERQLLAAARERARAFGAAPPPGSARDAEDLVRRRIDELAERRRGLTALSPREAAEIDRQAQENAQRLNALQRDRVIEEGNAQIAVIEQVRAFAFGIQQAQDGVAEAIRQGIPNAVEFSQQLDAAAKAVSQAEQEFRNAGSAVLDAIELPTGTAAERDARDVAIRDAEGRRARAQGAIDAAQREAADLEARAGATRQRLFVDPQTTFDSRLALARESVQQAQLPSGRIARALRILEFARDENTREIGDPRTTDERRQELAAELERGNEFLKLFEGAALAAARLGESLNRAAQSVESDLSGAVGDAEQARRRDLGFSTAQSRRELDARQADLADQRDVERRATAAIASERARLEARVIERGRALGEGDAFRRINEINEALSSGELNSQQQAALINERARLESSIQDLVDEFDQAAQAISDVSARRREVAQLAAEGRELALTPAQRAGETLARQLEALRVSFALQAEQTTGLVDQAGLGAAQNRALGQAIRQQAPLVAQFSDEVANAILQGPSRAALQASDASTVEGQRELNRLLRGDDPARDVNLLELQRQTAGIEELVRIAQNGPQVAQ